MTKKRNSSAIKNRADVLWGFFLLAISMVFFIVFLMNLFAVVKLYHCYVETDGKILGKYPVELISPAGQTQQVYVCQVTYDNYLADKAMCMPFVATNEFIRVVYDIRKPLSPYCGGKRPSFFRTIRIYAKSYFWILIGWISPSFLVIGLSVLYEAFYINRPKEVKPVTTLRSE